MEGMCVTLIYATFMHCFIENVDLNLCGTKETFRPIYTIGECPMSSIDGLEIMLPKEVLMCNVEEIEVIE